MYRITFRYKFTQNINNDLLLMNKYDHLKFNIVRLKDIVRHYTKCL